LHVHLFSRHAASIQTQIRERCGVPVLVLDYICDDHQDWWAVCELLDSIIGLPFDLVAIDPDLLSESKQFRERLHSILDGKHTSPFSRLGWIREAARWVESLVTERLMPIAQILQFNLSVDFVLLRWISISGKHYWLKATGKPNVHERHITEFLFRQLRKDRVSPLPIPEVLGGRDDWNAWLSAGDGVPLPENDSFALIQAATALSQLQIATLQCDQQLLSRGAFDQRLATLLASMPRIRSLLEEAMKRQTSTRVAPLSTERIAAICNLAAEALERLIEIQAPITILHGDLNRGNLMWRAHTEFIDWSEAYLGSSVVSLQHLLLLNLTDDLNARERTSRAMVDAYLSVWRSKCDNGLMRKCLRDSDLLAALSTIYGRGILCDGDPGFNESIYSFVRPIARHMERAATRLERSA
jgi:hypothetical protein